MSTLDKTSNFENQTSKNRPTKFFRVTEDFPGGEEDELIVSIGDIVTTAFTYRTRLNWSWVRHDVTRELGWIPNIFIIEIESSRPSYLENLYSDDEMSESHTGSSC